ncbi:MAG: hypothetical protein E6H59_02360 [Betaproteobacteria bacterium]|nr:MAG: hypothetical protein E6H59_02360 [Betaproteobacteria bacterium]
MKKGFDAGLALFAAILPAGFILAQSQGLEQKIWTLLDDGKAAYVSLAESDLRALGAGLDLPDGGRSITALAGKADGGAFDPRDVARLPAQQLGYKADWIVERFRRYNLDWDITALRLTSLNPEAKNYPWFIIINGGAANFYEFYVDLKNRPGWAQYLAQKLNVMIVTIPGNFKYGGWDLPVLDARRQPAYLLDRDLSMDEYEMRNAIYTNSLILQGLKALVTRHTSGDILLIGHSTSGELSMLAYEDPDLRARLKGRYLGWGSGGPARLELLRKLRGKEIVARAGASSQAGKTPLHVLERRDPPSYARGYSGFLNPLYEAGMTHLQIAERWLAAEARRRPNFKQQLQNLEHGADLGEKAWVENEIESLLKRTGNPWRIAVEDVEKDLYATNFTRMDGFQRMVWTTAKLDRNHWNAEEPMRSIEVFIANEYRAKNPDAQVRLINWDVPMTHYGHLELPQQLAAAHYSVVRWLVRP